MIEYDGQPRTDRVNRPPQRAFVWLAAVAVWVVLGAIAFGLLATILTFGAGRAMGAFSPILAMIAFTGIGTFMRSLRRAQARTLLAYLNQAVRLNLPLPPMLRAAELAERGRLRVRLRRLRQRLEAGDSLGDAVERAAPDVPHRVLATIGAAEHLGQVPRALHRLTLAEMPRAHGATAASLQLKWYPLVMLTFVSLVVNVFMIFVAPKFSEIFDDFGVPMPRTTVLLLEAWQYVGPPLLVVMALTLLLYNAHVLAQAVAPRWSILGPAKPLVDRVVWALT